MHYHFKLSLKQLTKSRSLVPKQLSQSYNPFFRPNPKVGGLVGVSVSLSVFLVRARTFEWNVIRDISVNLLPGADGPRPKYLGAIFIFKGP